MWNDILGVLQQKLDDAAEYLNEDGSSSSSENDISIKHEKGVIEEELHDVCEGGEASKLVNKHSYVLPENEIKVNVDNRNTSNLSEEQAENKSFDCNVHTKFNKNESENSTEVISGYDENVSLLIEKLAKQRERIKKLSAERNALKTEFNDVKRHEKRENSENATIETHVQDINTLELERVKALEYENNELKMLFSTTKEKLESLECDYNELTKNNNSNGELDELQVNKAEEKFNEKEQYYLQLLRNKDNEHEREITKVQAELLMSNKQTAEIQERVQELEETSIASQLESRVELQILREKNRMLKMELQEERQINNNIRLNMEMLKRKEEQVQIEQEQRVNTLTIELETLQRERCELEEHNKVYALEMQNLRCEVAELRTLMEQNENRYTTTSTEYCQDKSESVAFTPMKRWGVTKKWSEFSECKKEVHNDDLVKEDDHESNREITQHNIVDHNMNVPSLNFPSALSGNNSLQNSKNEQRIINRLQKKIIEQSIELERLILVEKNAVSVNAQFDELSQRYNTILEMYGQLEEEVNNSDVNDKS